MKTEPTEQQMQPKPQQPPIAVIRAFPAPPHKHRYGGLEQWVPDEKMRPDQEMEVQPDGTFKPVFKDGAKVYRKHALPWPATDIKCYIVDHPKPYDPNANGGYAVEISPASLAMMRKDPRLNVRIEGGEGGDAPAAIEAKARATAAEDELSAVRRQMANAVEEASRLREQSNLARGLFDRDAAAAAQRITALENELGMIRLQLAKGR